MAFRALVIRTTALGLTALSGCAGANGSDDTGALPVIEGDWDLSNWTYGGEDEMEPDPHDGYELNVNGQLGIDAFDSADLHIGIGNDDCCAWNLEGDGTASVADSGEVRIDLQLGWSPSAPEWSLPEVDGAGAAFDCTVDGNAMTCVNADADERMGWSRSSG